MKISKRSYVVAGCAFLIAFAANYPQFQLSPLAHLLMPQYQLNTAQFSMLFSAMMIPGILLSFVAGILSDRFGVKRTILVTAIITTAALVARIFVSDFLSFFACMILVGALATFFNASVGKIMGHWFPPEKISVMVGIAISGTTAASVLAMSTTALFPSVQIAFVFAAALSAVVAVIWLIFVKEERSTKTPADGGGTILEESNKLGFLSCFKTVAKNKQVWFVGLTLGLMLAASLSLVGFMPQALSADRGIDPVLAGIVSTSITVGQLLGTIFVPIACSKVGKMKPVVIVCIFICAIGVAFAWKAPGMVALVLALFLTGFTCFGIIAAMMSVPVQLPTVGLEYAGTAGGLAATLQLLIGVSLPSYIITPLVGDNFTLLFIIIGGLVLLGAVFVAFIPEVLSKDKGDFEGADLIGR